MGAPAVGAVVLIPFPFSDLSGAKKRPALVLADVGRGDWVCAQITSNPYGDVAAIELAEDDCVDGSLARVSYIRPGKLFTAHESLSLRVVVRCSKLAEDGGREHAFKERARCDRLEPPIEARLLVYERGELESFSAEYDGPHRTLGKSRGHKAIEELDDFKLRLGTLNGVGEQKAVDGLIHGRLGLLRVTGELRPVSPLLSCIPPRHILVS